MTLGHFSMKEAGQALIGAFGISFPFLWMDVFTGIGAFIMWLGGALVVWLTAYNLYLRNKKLTKERKD